MIEMTLAVLEAKLDELDDGVLRSGKHKPGNREFCALEFKSQVDGLPWTDTPITVGMPDLRPLNDANWSSDKARTKAILPVLVALWNWRRWSFADKQEWAKTVTIETVRHIISGLPALPEDIVAQCQNAKTIEDAAAAAARYTDAAAAARYTDTAAAARYTDAAAAARYAAVAAAARYAAVVAAAAARYADAAAADAVLTKACHIWIEACEGIK